ncbi:MAG: OprO/OprP family phosphate-selective porin [Planctomycetaceae bacterium]
MRRWKRLYAPLVSALLTVSLAPAIAEETPQSVDLDALVRRLQAAEERIRELEARQEAAPAVFLQPAADPPLDPYRQVAGEEGPPDCDELEQNALRQLADDFATRIRKLEENYEKSKAADRDKACKAAMKPTVLWTGQVQTDYVWFGQSDLNRETVGDMQDGADFRRARLGAYGEFYEYTEYRIEFDFAFIERPAFLDNWVGWRKVPYLGTVKVGRFFEPFGLERITSNRFTTFMERALGDQAFDPARRNGIMFYDNTPDGDITWSAGVFRSFTDGFGDNVATQGAWAGTGRLTWMPWYDEPSDGRYYLHLGADYSYRAAGEESVTFRAQPEIRMRDAGNPLNVPFFVNTGAIPADHWQLFGLEAALVLNRFSIQSEYVYTAVSRLDGPSPGFQSIYAYASFFLTDDYRPFQRLDSLFQRRTAVFDRVIPNTNFMKGPNSPGDPGIGAWELAARWSYINLNDKGILGGRLHELTFGLNWYWNPYTRITLNYIKSFLDNPEFGKSTADIYGMRFGFDF